MYLKKNKKLRSIHLS